ncbi:helix-turn-helix transcriptional regulator [Streptomyces sp. H27-C3]|uniref:helix-turn-helix transcriptional regulator n=1 Tax=Streptomyces sp. H27-C3 TaxID=3046305 RepID=UPI0024B956D8|nr:helix-turn-helix transcriptional regulator [Streptomyces sp. H27-C3]MDJ0465019.1 helix-turn-helix transcriptional regulator [Streptomyces sp. H27-C3]
MGEGRAHEDGQEPPARLSEELLAKHSAKFAERLDYLFENMFPASQGRPYTHGEVARATGLSTTAIGYLRSGRSKPTLDTAILIALFFGVPMDAFVDDEVAEALKADLADLCAYRDKRARRIMRRSAALPATMQDSLDLVITEYRRAAGLPADPDED